MHTYGAPPERRPQRLDELRRLIAAGLYTVDPERIARAMVYRARRALAVRLDVQRPG
jgi:hypothetical protein